jgi:hypothetical protein
MSLTGKNEYKVNWVNFDPNKKQVVSQLAKDFVLDVTEER